MSQRDGFAGGFVVGAVFGSVVGGVLGAVLATRSTRQRQDETPSLLRSGKSPKFETEEDMEVARRRLEDKIAQLNLAIDDVRQQMGPVNGNVFERD